MMDAKVIVRIGKFLQVHAVGQNALLGAPVQIHAQINIAFKRLQLRIQLQNTIHNIPSFVLFFQISNQAIIYLLLLPLFYHVTAFIDKLYRNTTFDKKFANTSQPIFEPLVE